MRILFWGTPDFAVPSLRALDDEGFDIVGVVTQPDRPAGRGRKLTPSPVKRVALEADFPVLTPDRPRGDAFMEQVRALEPDISVVVAYGHILRPEVLELPPMGSVNVHASLLPKLRGAAPINWAIARGHPRTGVTIMRMVEAMDAGAIIHQVEEPILPDETAGELTVRLSELGAQALVEALALLSAGAVEEVEQEHDQATYAPKIDRDTARIDWDRPAGELAAHVRAMDPVPGAWSLLDDAPVKLFRPVVWSEEEVDGLAADGPPNNGGPKVPSRDVPPGTVVAAITEEGVIVAAGEGGVAFREVQPPGKRRMEAADWINGRGVEPGQRFG
ncbi:MAG: methionyl-tRNA formyltransferase [Longimicrobiales bacterium]|nr:methionyl-tRNA formyltransferase [Longimicrobiales bacterium]